MLSPFVLCLPLNYTVKKGMKKGNTIDRFSCTLFILPVQSLSLDSAGSSEKSHHWQNSLAKEAFEDSLLAFSPIKLFPSIWPIQSFHGNKWSSGQST